VKTVFILHTQDKFSTCSATNWKSYRESTPTTSTTPSKNIIDEDIPRQKFGATYNFQRKHKAERYVEHSIDKTMR
jgi:hypothetical protein